MLGVSVQGYPTELPGLQLSPAGIAAAMATVRRHQDVEETIEDSGAQQTFSVPHVVSISFHLKRTKHDWHGLSMRKSLWETDAAQNSSDMHYLIFLFLAWRLFLQVPCRNSQFSAPVNIKIGPYRNFSITFHLLITTNTTTTTTTTTTSATTTTTTTATIRRSPWSLCLDMPWEDTSDGSEASSSSESESVDSDLGDAGLSDGWRP